MKKEIHQDVYVGSVSLAGALFVLFINRSLPPDSKTMPYILSGLLAVFSILIIFDGIKKTGEGAGKDRYLTWDVVRIPFITLLLVGLYVLLFYLIGYFLATPVMIAVFMRFLKRTSWKEIILIILGYLLFVYLLFVKVLTVPIAGFGWIGNWFNMR